MRVNGTSTWLKRIALLILFSASTVSPALAQTPQVAQPSLETALIPGRTVWITDAGGREEKMRVVGISGGIVSTTAGEGSRRFPTTDVRRVRVRHADGLFNGALIGGGAAVATGLFLCRLTEPWENCRDNVGPIVRIGAMGAGVGLGVDALIRGRRTIYSASGAARLHAAPIVARRVGGLQVMISF